MSVGFSDAGATTYINVEYVGIRGEGCVAPRLIFELEARTTSEKIEAEIHHLKVRARRKSEGGPTEVLADGDVTYTPVGLGGRQVSVQMPISRPALASITRSPMGDVFALELSFEGLMRVRHESEEISRYGSAPPAGEWTFLGVGRSGTTRLDVRIPRSDWISRVLGPTGHSGFVLPEIKVRRGSGAAKWRSAADRIQEAEELLVLGKYADVFFHCRAALESLPGAPKGIFEFIQDEEKKKAIDEMTKYFVNFLHVGRHVRAGEGFAVDHEDAEYAVAATKILLAYTSSL